MIAKGVAIATYQIRRAKCVYKGGAHVAILLENVKKSLASPIGGTPWGARPISAHAAILLGIVRKSFANPIGGAPLGACPIAFVHGRVCSGRPQFDMPSQFLRLICIGLFYVWCVYYVSHTQFGFDVKYFRFPFCIVVKLYDIINLLKTKKIQMYI